MTDTDAGSPPPCDRDTVTAYVLSLGAFGLVAYGSPYGVSALDERHAVWVRMLGLLVLMAGLGLALMQQYTSDAPSRALIITGCTGVVAGAALGGVGSELAYRAVATGRQLRLARAIPGQ